GRRAATLGWSVAALSSALTLGYVVLLRVDVQHGLRQFDNHWLPGVMWAVAWPVLGAIVLGKQPGNRLALVFLVIGLGSATALATGEYAVHATLVEPGSLPAAAYVLWVSTVLGNVSWVSIILVPQLFPDGRPLSARWRWLLWLTVALITLAALSFMVQPGRLDPVLPLANPFGIAALRDIHWLGTAGQVVLLPSILVVVVGAVSTLVLRFLRARGVERQQMKFFVVAVVVSAVGLSVYERLPYAFVVNAMLALVAPVAFGLAITRHGLYDIDRVISRTVSYAVLTGLLVAAYAGLVTVVTRLVPSGNAVAVAGSTLAVAALFQPLRRRVQAAVDSRFNRARYDAERTVDAFSHRLRSEVDLETVQDDLLRVVTGTMQPAHAALWLRPSGGS
ncbi:MAG: hypothetical protein M3Z02_01870, partial [Actinomycetota bacterium]|nr:hypothetical protein [Actinomycetota bacterium]